MAKDKKKAAKIALKKKAEVEAAASRLVMIAGIHRVSRNVTGRTDCGLRVNDAENGGAVGWSYGTKEDVSCEYCLEGSLYGSIIVPPPLPDDLSELPVLDMAEFEKS